MPHNLEGKKRAMNCLNYYIATNSFGYMELKITDEDHKVVARFDGTAVLKELQAEERKLKSIEALRSAVQRGDRVECIKELRSAYGLSLVDAKTIVEVLLLSK
jgi:ribosomal protein L7/L12